MKYQEITNLFCLGATISFASLSTAQETKLTAEKLSIISNAPKDAEMVLSLFDIKEKTEDLMATNFAQSIKSLSKDSVSDFEKEFRENTDDKIGIENADALLKSFSEAFSDDVCLIFGDGTAEFINKILGLYQLNSKLTYKSTLATSSSSKIGMEQIKEQLYKAVETTFKKTTIPRLTLLSSTPDAVALGKKIELPSQMIEDLESEEGVILGTTGEGDLIRKTITTTIGALIESFGSNVKTPDYFTDIFKNQKIVITYGAISDDLYGFTLGPDEIIDTLATSLEDSILSLEENNQLQPWLNKNLLMYQYTSKNIGEKITSLHTFTPMIKAVSEFLLESDKYKSVGQKISPRLKFLAEEGNTLMGYQKVDNYVSIGYVEDGIKIEGFGGAVKNGYDLSTPHQLATPENTLFSMHYTGDREHSKKAWNYVQELGAIAYEGGIEIAKIESNENPKMAQGNAIAQMVAPSLKKIWGNVRNIFENGLEGESLLMFDMSGEVPTLPNVPQAVVGKKIFPRISMVAPVKDRELISTEWTQIPLTVNELAESMGAPIKLPGTMSSDSDGLTTHFFPFPFFTDDMLPSSSINDDYFVIGSSKKHANLIAKSQANENKGKGVHYVLNGSSLSTSLKNGLDAINTIMPQGADVESKANNVFELIGTMKKIDMKSWDDEGTTRHQMSIHFKDLEKN